MYIIIYMYMYIQVHVYNYSYIQLDICATLRGQLKVNTINFTTLSDKLKDCIQNIN